jgi:hypothetical protein
MQRRDRQGPTWTRPSAARASGRPPPRSARGGPRPGAAGAAAARGRTHGGRPAAWRGGSSSSAEVVSSPPPSCCAPRGFANRAPAISGSARRRAPSASRRRLARGTGRECGAEPARYLGWARSVPAAKGSQIFPSTADHPLEIGRFRCSDAVHTTPSRSSPG